MDSDNFGLTKAEEDLCWEAFQAFDKDNRGYIEAKELGNILEYMGQNTTETT